MHRFGNGRVSEKALSRQQDFALVATASYKHQTLTEFEKHIHKNQNWISTTLTSKTAETKK